MLDPQSVKLLEIVQNPSYLPLIFAVLVWFLAWKGVALWKASKNSQRNWFIAILILNTLGVLEIVYLFYFQRKKENTIDV